MPFLGLDAIDPRPLSEEGIWYLVRYPQGHALVGQPVEIEGEKIELKIAGPDSDRHRAYLKEHGKRITRLVQNAAPNEPDPKETDRLIDECVPMIVLDWRGVREEDGSPTPCTRDNLDRFFAKLHWIALQVDNAASQRGRFFPREGQNSSTPSASASDET
jgi:hypothetical protein